MKSLARFQSYNRRESDSVKKKEKEKKETNEQQTQTLNVVFSRTELDLLPQYPEDEAARWLNNLQPLLILKGSI